MLILDREVSYRPASAAGWPSISTVWRSSRW